MPLTEEKRLWLKEYRQRNKEHIRKVARKKYLRRREYFLAKVKEWCKEHPERIREAKRRQYKKEQPLMLIRQKTHHRFKDLKKTGKCEHCGTKENLEFHHLTPYSYDNFMLLCTSCHMKEDGMLKSEATVIRNGGRPKANRSRK